MVEHILRLYQLLFYEQGRRRVKKLSVKDTFFYYSQKSLRGLTYV